MLMCYNIENNCTFNSIHRKQGKRMNGKNKNPNDLKNKKNNPQKPSPKNGMNFFIWFLIIFGFLYMFQWVFSSMEETSKGMTYKQLYDMVETNDQTGEILSAVMVRDRVEGKLISGQNFSVNIPNEDPRLLGLLLRNVPDFDVKPPQTFLSNLFFSLGPMLLFILFLWFFIYKGSSSMGGGKMMSFGKSRAKLATKDKMKITFDDVAGIEEAKEELKEVIEFLKSPKKFQRLGGKMPKGVLLMGPPGTGKKIGRAHV